MNVEDCLTTSESDLEKQLQFQFCGVAPHFVSVLLFPTALVRRKEPEICSSFEPETNLPR